MDKVKDVLSTKIVEATTYIKGMSIHEDEISFLGMDERGQVFAQLLLNAGVRIRLWEPTVKTPAERQLGGENVYLAKTIADAMKSTHVVFINLSLEDLYEMMEDEPLIKSFHQKSVLVCTPMSTFESEELSRAFSRGGCSYTELAFCGSNSIAEKAQIKIIVGSSEEEFSKLKPILSVFGILHYAGAIPRATAVKQSIDLVIAAENAALALATAHMHKQGLNSDVFLDVMKQVRGNDLDTKLSSFKFRNYDQCQNVHTNDEVLLGLTNLLEESKKTGIDGMLIGGLKKYTELAKHLSGGSSDISSLYDVLDPPATSAK